MSEIQAFYLAIILIIGGLLPEGIRWFRDVLDKLNGDEEAE